MTVVHCWYQCNSLTLTRKLMLLGFLQLASLDRSSSSSSSSSESFRLGFGSCHQQFKPTRVFESLSESRLDAFAFLGDNVYNDYDDCASFNAADDCMLSRRVGVALRFIGRVGRKLVHSVFSALLGVGGPVEVIELAVAYNALEPKLRGLFANVPVVVATWDDHDFGENDSDSTLAYKENSLQQFVAFWSQWSPAMAKALEKVASSSSSSSPLGIATSHIFGEGEQSVRLILLDTRFHRTKLDVETFPDKPSELRSSGDEEGRLWNCLNPDPAFPASLSSSSHSDAPRCLRVDDSSEARILSEEQWAWLGAELSKPAGIRVVASSTQVLREYNGQEAWANMPRELERLINILPAGEKSIIISGDVHYSDLSVLPEHNLFDVTSSGLTETWPFVHGNTHRLSPSSVVRDPNFGVLGVDWGKEELTIEIRDDAGDLRFTRVLPFAAITQPSRPFGFKSCRTNYRNCTPVAALPSNCSSLLHSSSEGPEERPPLSVASSKRLLALASTSPELTL